jgi:hypothetical protein
LMQGSLSFCVAAGAALGGYSAKFLMENYSRRYFVVHQDSAL